MSDTFDKVKSREEEQLLMGRARFIDACEAALSERQIKEMKKKIGKYLYVVLPKDQDSHEDKDLWQGRVTAIKKHVQKVVLKSQAEILEVIRNEIKALGERIDDNAANLQEDINLLKIKLESCSV